MNEKELRQMFVNQAIAYVGVEEGSTRHREIIDTYNKIHPLPQNYRLQYKDAWCAAFVSVIAKECGLLDIIPAECSCDRQIALAKKMGIWVESDSYVPESGDIIQYDWQDSGIGNNKGSSDHVGIVISVSGGKMQVVEGNYSDSVKVRTLAVNGKFIRGYIAPKFSSKATEKESVNISSKEVCEVELQVLKQGSKGSAVKALQILLIGYGYSCGASGVDGDFGSATLAAVKKFQKKMGLTVDGIVGAKTWAKLLG